MDSMDLAAIFADLKAVPQDDGPVPVCAVAYPPDFVEAMDYFRAVLLAQEYSSRALDLTSICMKHNPANYTVWHFRRECLKALSSSARSTIDEELVNSDLEFSATLGGPNPKNYQIWYHRRALLEAVLLEIKVDDSQKLKEDIQNHTLDVTHKELVYISRVLQEDAKNYHAWSHRQWLLRCSINRTCGTLWKEELGYAHSLIEEDIRNNSAWNHRWFIVHKGAAIFLSVNAAHREAKYALDAAQQDPWNESPWSYFSGILKEQLRRNNITKAEKTELLIFYETRIKHLQEQFNKAHEPKEEIICPNILSSRIFLLESQGDLDALRSAAHLANELALEHDKIRRKYWLYQEKELRAKIENEISS